MMALAVNSRKSCQRLYHVSGVGRAGNRARAIRQINTLDEIQLSIGLNQLGSNNDKTPKEWAL